MKQHPPESLEAWFEGYCRPRGFDLQFALKNGVEIVEAKRAQRLGYSLRAGVVFHSFDPFTDEARTSGPIRYQHPLPYTDGNGKSKLRKFQQRKGSPYHDPYFCAGLNWKSIAANTKADIVFSEGPTRALAGARHGYAVIALPGVNGHGEGDELHPSVARFKWKGRKVYIAFDADAINNPDVRHHEGILARKLTALGARVYLVRIPAKEPHWGMDDWLGMPGGPESFPALLLAAQPWQAATDCPALETEELSMVKTKPVDWLWKGYLARGMQAMISGDPGSGKTYIALDIAASLSNGRVPYSKQKCKPVTTLYMSVENPPEYVTAPRFKAQGGNPKRFFTVKEAFTLQEIDRIEATIRKTKAGLIIIDPLQSYLGADVDAHRSNETRPVMDGLLRLAEKYNLVVLIIRHLAKSSGGRAIHRGLGSIDITAAVRSEMMVGHAPDDPNHRAMVQIKNSLGPHAPSLAFEITGKDLEAKLEWRGESPLTSADLLAPESGPKRKTQLDEAREYLSAALQDGPKLLRDELEADAPVPLHVLQKASTQMGLRKSRKGEGGAWVWALPKYATRREQ
jgi:hypothetical protein